jgi:hypothetical protein
MLPTTKEEEAEVVEYFLSQSPLGAQVAFLQKIYSETLLGHCHDVWDVHASDGRWWVITNPTNLYSQDQFPNMDLAVTFHIGLCLRIPRTHRQREWSRHLAPFAAVLDKMREASDALDQAHSVSDYQAVGMRGREALLAFVSAAQDAHQWTSDTPPQRANFLAWSDIICGVALAGERHKERRHLFKLLLKESWSYANWLTHAQSATWHDAEAAQATIEHALGLATSLVIRHIRSVPELCPNCGSRGLFPQEGWRSERPEIAWERPVCDDCGWVGLPAPIGERSEVEIEQEDLLISRVGKADDNKCIIPTVPLRTLRRPGHET